jgi:hypothetical protein
MILIETYYLDSDYEEIHLDLPNRKFAIFRFNDGGFSGSLDENSMLLAAQLDTGVTRVKR